MNLNSPLDHFDPTPSLNEIDYHEENQNSNKKIKEDDRQFEEDKTEEDDDDDDESDFNYENCM